MVLMFISFIFSYPWFPIPLSLPTYSQSHILSIFIFLTHGDDNEVSFLILADSFWIFFKASIMNILFPV